LTLIALHFNGTIPAPARVAHSFVEAQGEHRMRLN
jgi:hypothetical protein